MIVRLLSDKENESLAARLVTAIESTALKLIEESVDNPSLATTILGIPIFGLPIHGALVMMQSKAWERRLKQLILSLHEEAMTLDETKIDNTFFATEDFYDAVRKVIENTLKTRDDLKIKLYARILTRLPLVNNTQFRYRAEDFLSILLELTPADLQVARIIYDQQKDLATKIRHTENEISTIRNAGWDNIAVISRLDAANFEFALKKLDRAGLITPVRQASEGYRLEMCMITSTFRTLMTLVERLD